MVYNKSRMKLKSSREVNPREEWIKTPSAFQGIIPKSLYDQAQAVRHDNVRLAPPTAQNDSPQNQIGYSLSERVLVREPLGNERALENAVLLIGIAVRIA